MACTESYCWQTAGRSEMVFIFWAKVSQYSCLSKILAMRYVREETSVSTHDTRRIRPPPRALNTSERMRILERYCCQCVKHNGTTPATMGIDSLSEDQIIARTILRRTRPCIDKREHAPDISCLKSQPFDLFCVDTVRSTSQRIKRRPFRKRLFLSNESSYLSKD